MDAIYLGYRNINNYVTPDGKTIDGLKVYYSFESASNVYTGFEVGTWFIDRNKSDLIEKVKNLKPLDTVHFSVVTNGKRTFINDVT